ncbi:MAG: hypothetical protein K9L82_09335 [Chromatiaceae bacterium]|nr:hypothetical protein [Chromatiaceae bacterium]
MTDKTRTERRLLASIRQVKTGDETAHNGIPDSTAEQATVAAKPAARAKPKTATSKASPTSVPAAAAAAASASRSAKPAASKPRPLVPASRAKPRPTEPESTIRQDGYQSSRRVWPD